MILIAIAAISTFLCPLEGEMNEEQQDKQLRRFQKSQVHMGTSFKIVFYASSPASANRAFAAAFARVRQLDQILSNYKDDSELTRFCLASPHPRPTKISRDFFRVLQAAQVWNKRTGGAFDVTIGPLSQLWRRARRKKTLPSTKRLQAALARVGGRHLVLNVNKQTGQLKRGGMRIDLGGIAKGFATDEALQALAKCGIRRAVVNGGGDLSIGQPPPGKKGWPVGIGGVTQRNRKPTQFVQLKQAGIATSGDLYQSVTISGKTYSHIVDPKTGLGLTRRIAVSVIARDGMTADALASAISVMGPGSGMKLVRRLVGVEAMIAVRDPRGRIVVSRSKGFPLPIGSGKRQRGGCVD